MNGMYACLDGHNGLGDVAIRVQLRAPTLPGPSGATFPHRLYLKDYLEATNRTTSVWGHIMREIYRSQH
jgi:hypothetical protein